MIEASFKDFVAEQWQGVFVPAGTPDAIVQRLNGEIARTLQSQELIALTERLGVTLLGGTPVELARRQEADSARWAQVIRTGNIRAE